MKSIFYKKGFIGNAGQFFVIGFIFRKPFILWAFENINNNCPGGDVSAFTEFLFRWLITGFVSGIVYSTGYKTIMWARRLCQPLYDSGS